MSPSNKDTDLIVHLIKEQDEKRSIQVKGLHKNMESAFDAFNVKLDTIKEENQAINAAVQKNYENIKEIKKDTAIWRWVHRNPKVSFILIGVIFSGIVGILGHLDKEAMGNILKKLIGL